MKHSLPCPLSKSLRLPFFCMLIFLSACQTQPQAGYCIRGTVEGLEEGRVFLAPFMKAGGADTVALVGGQFTFQGRTDRPDVYALGLEGRKGRIFLFLHNEEIEVSATCMETFAGRASGPANDLWERFSREGEALNRRLRRLEAPDAAEQREDSLRAFKLRFVREHASSPVAALILLRNRARFSPEEVLPLVRTMKEEPLLQADGNVQELLRVYKDRL